PFTGTPAASVTFTAGDTGTGAAAAALWPSPAAIVIATGGPEGAGGGSVGPGAGAGVVTGGGVVTAVPMKMSGLPDNPVAVANNEFPPPAPKVQLPTAATPVESVVAVSPVIVPPPLRMLNVTTTPATGAPVAAVTRAAGRIGTAVSAGADCPSPAKIAIVV